MSWKQQRSKEPPIIMQLTYFQLKIFWYYVLVSRDQMKMTKMIPWYKSGAKNQISISVFCFLCFCKWPKLKHQSIRISKHGLIYNWCKSKVVTLDYNKNIEYENNQPCRIPNQRWHCLRDQGGWHQSQRTQRDMIWHNVAVVHRNWLFNMLQLVLLS